MAEFEARDGRRVVLRSLRKRDIDSCLAFANILVREKRTNPEIGVTSFEKPVTRKEELRFLRAVVRGVAQKDAVNVAAFVNGRLVGNCEVKRRRTKDEHHCGVFGIAILAGFRGIGIGERMMAEALRGARAIGISLVELSVFANNAVAVHLYEKMGFCRAGVIPGKIRRGVREYDEITMYADFRGSDISTKSRRRKS
jgi:ribosomal protein S18 acetylase RimI-like enzyme